MADKEITALTAAATLDGTETIHVVQSTNSRKTTIDDVVDDRDLLSSPTPTAGGPIDTNSHSINQSKGADVASATALTLGTDGNVFDITGTTTITSIATLGIGTIVVLHFDAALTLTHHATDLILPGGVNITTAAGDEGVFYEYATGDWRCVSYKRQANAVPDQGLLTTSSPTFAHPIVDNTTETQFALSGTTPAINPSDGGLQTWTLTGNSTPTFTSWSNGDAIVLQVIDGTAYTITWTNIDEWIGGSAPTLDTTNENWIVIWQKSSTLYANSLGVSS